MLVYILGNNIYKDVISWYQQSGSLGTQRSSHRTENTAQRQNVCFTEGGKLKILLHLLIFICLFVCVHTCHKTLIKVREPCLWASVFFSNGSPRDPTQVVRLGDKSLCPLSHLTRPQQITLNVKLYAQKMALIKIY